MLKEAIRIVNPSYGFDAARSIVRQALEATKFTPDIDILQERERNLLFVCDELKKDHPQHRLLGDAQFCFPAYTEKSFRFWENDDPTEHRIPMLEPDGSPLHNQYTHFPPVAKIKGELYAVKAEETFLKLDPYKENTVQFVRQRVKLVVPYRKVVWLKDHSLDPDFGVYTGHNRLDYNGSSVKHSAEKTCIIRAWMYIGKPEFWDPILTAYNWKAVEHHHSDKRRWCETYYSIRRPPLPQK